MSVLLITYDLMTPGTNYTDLLEKIKTFPWARLSESSYAIKTDKQPQLVYSILKPYIDQNDNIYIVNLRKPYSGYGPNDVNKWLENNLEY